MNPDDVVIDTISKQQLEVVRQDIKEMTKALKDDEWWVNNFVNASSKIIPEKKFVLENLTPWRKFGLQEFVPNPRPSPAEQWVERNSRIRLTLDQQNLLDEIRNSEFTYVQHLPVGRQLGTTMGLLLYMVYFAVQCPKSNLMLVTKTAASKDRSLGTLNNLLGEFFIAFDSHKNGVFLANTSTIEVVAVSHKLGVEDILMGRKFSLVVFDNLFSTVTANSVMFSVSEVRAHTDLLINSLSVD